MQVYKTKKEELYRDDKKTSTESAGTDKNVFAKKIGDAGTENMSGGNAGSGGAAFFMGGGTGKGNEDGIEDRYTNHTLTKDDLSDAYVTEKFAAMSVSEIFNYRRACTDAEVKSGILDIIKIRPKDPYKSYMGKEFTVNSSSAIIRDDKYAEIKYGKDDVLPEGKKIGDAKTIPDQTKVYVTNYAYVNASSRYAYVEDYGWTSADNLKGGMFNETIGKKEIKWDSQLENNKTYGGKDAYARNKDSFSFDERVPAVDFANGAALTVIETMTDSKGVKFVNATDGTLSGWTKATNLKISGDEKTATVNDPDARIRDKVAYGETSDIIHQGDRVAVKEYSTDTDPAGKYAKVFSTKKDGENYVEDKELGWVLSSKLQAGWADFKSATAEWKEGEYTGQADIVDIVGNLGPTKQVSISNAEHYQVMAEGAAAAGIELRVESGFRDFTNQAGLVFSYSQQEKGVAGYTGFNPADAAGTSLHQQGMAFDLNNKGNTTINNWMMEHAWEYDFIRPYKAYNESHHWEYRPAEIKKPEYFMSGKKYMKRTFYSVEPNRLNAEWEITKDVYDANVPKDEAPQQGGK